MAAATTYDSIVYTTRPRLVTHPDTLATVATLMGLHPAPVTRCRVLEIGCGTGGNLTPMAVLLPESRFVGVDLSPVQIALAERSARELGLSNVEFRAASILDLGDDLGEFDYIIAHGVYSWVPPAVQEKLLALYGRLLSPHGVGYVSYNVLPGWHLRGIVRDALQFHTRPAETEEDKIRAARGLLKFLAHAVPDTTATAYGKVVKDEIADLVDEPDYYLFHEMLEADNAPVYFTEFMARASAAGLQFLGEAGPMPRLSNLAEDVQEALRAVAPDLVVREQYLDFVFGRQFRRTLLCRADVPLDRTPSAKLLLGMRASGCAQPVSDDPDLTAGVVEEFAAPNDKKAGSSSPLVKAALVHLWREFPRVVPVEELAAAVADRIEVDVAAVRPPLVQMLAEGYLGGLVLLHTYAPPVAPTPSERPVGFPPARVEAADRDVVPTTRHMHVKLDPFDRFVLRLLDGTRDRSAVAAAVEEGVRAGAVPPPDGPVAESVDAALRRLGRSAVLVG